jgi:hypothetical protein
VKTGRKFKLNPPAGKITGSAANSDDPTEIARSNNFSHSSISRLRR